MSPTANIRTSDIKSAHFAAVCGIIASCLEVGREQLTAETLLREDLGGDSIDMLALALELEEEFGVIITDEVLDRIRTIAEAASSIKSAVEVRRIAEAWEDGHE